MRSTCQQIYELDAVARYRINVMIDTPVDALHWRPPTESIRSLHVIALTKLFPPKPSW